MLIIILFNTNIVAVFIYCIILICNIVSLVDAIKLTKKLCISSGECSIDIHFLFKSSFRNTILRMSAEIEELQYYCNKVRV